MTTTHGRRLRTAAVVLVALVAAGWVGWRVLAPAEVLAPAVDAYPAATAEVPRVTGRSPRASLFVDGRIRVYAARRQVSADAPVAARDPGTPRWSLRRWPQELSGMVAVGTTVVSRWSDGDLIAVDGRNGTIAWRAPGPPGGGFTGRRTAAETVWAPAGMSTAGDTVLVTGGRRVVALNARTGARQWTADLATACGTGGFTTAGGRFVCGTDVYDAATGRPEASWPAGPSTPLGCGTARSACGGLRDSAGHGWVVTGPAPRRSRALDQPGSTVAGELVLSGPGPVIVARSPVTGAEVWRWSAPSGDTAQVLAAQHGAVHLLTARGRELVTLRTATGAPRSRFVLTYDLDRTDWSVGHVQAAGGFVAVERLASPPEADEPDPQYYFSVLTVIIAAT